MAAVVVSLLYTLLHSSDNETSLFSRLKGPLPSNKCYVSYWKLRGKIIRTVLCRVVYDSCEQFLNLGFFCVFLD